MDKHTAEAIDWIFENAYDEDFVNAVIRIFKEKRWKEVIDVKGYRTSRDICDVCNSIETIIKTLHEYGHAENIVNDKLLSKYDALEKYYPNIKEENMKNIENYSATELGNIINEKQDEDFIIVEFDSGDGGIKIFKT